MANPVLPTSPTYLNLWPQYWTGTTTSSGTAPAPPVNWWPAAGIAQQQAASQTSFNWPITPVTTPPPSWRARSRARVWLGEDEEIPDGPWTVLRVDRDPQTWWRFAIIEADGLPKVEPGMMLPVHQSFEQVLDAVRSRVTATLAGLELL